MNNPSEVKVKSEYGAPMGRRSHNYLEGPVTLSNVVLDSGGYDEGGAYWGTRQRGETLFVSWDKLGNAVFFDAQGLEDAQQHIVDVYDIPVSDITFQPQSWTLYWHSHDCPNCEGTTSPSEHKNSATCGCGHYIEKADIYDTETEEMHPFA
jgi:ribosomal protein S27AE